MISIITPAFNSEKYLENCIKSIMNQNFEDFEHIVVDGGSTDGTVEILRKYEDKYPLRWISEKDNGMYDAIRKGFSMAKGDILCWLNSDDMYMPWTLQTVDKVMQDSRVRWLTGLPGHFNSDGIQYMSPHEKHPAEAKFIKRGWMEGRKLYSIQQESCFWTRELYEKVGGIDEQYKLAGDFHLWVKFAGETDLYMVNSVLAGFRVHAGQLSGNRDAYYREIGTLSLWQRLMSRLGMYKKFYGIYGKLSRKLCRKKNLMIEIH